MIPRFTCLLHEAKRDYVSLHKQYSWAEKDGVGTKESDLKSIRLASYLHLWGEKIFVGRRARDRFTLAFCLAVFALSAPSGLTHTCFVYSCNGHPSSLTGFILAISHSRRNGLCNYS